MLGSELLIWLIRFTLKQELSIPISFNTYSLFLMMGGLTPTMLKLIIIITTL